MTRTPAATRARRRGMAQANAMTRDREAALEQMNPNLRHVYDAVARQVDAAAVSNIMFHHQVGRLVKEVRESPADYAGFDGTSGFELLERALVTNARTLRRAATFAAEYTADEATALADMQNPQNGFRLTWSHVNVLLSCDTAAQRARFATDAVEKCWDPKQLHENIKTANGRTGGHGRPHGVPETIEGQLRQFLQATTVWNTKFTEVWAAGDEGGNNIFTNLDEAEDGEWTPEVCASITGLHGQLQAMIANLNTLKPQAKKAMSKARRLVEAAEAAVAVAAASADQPVTTRRRSAG